MAEKTKSTDQSPNIDKSNVVKPTLNPAKETDSDPELDDLLDSALGDFENPIPSDKAHKKETPYKESTGTGNDIQSSTEPVSQEASQDEAHKQFEDMLKAFMQHDPDMLKNIEKLANVEDDSGEREEERNNIERTLQDTLGNLAQNAEQLQGNLPDDELFKLLGNLDMGDAAGAHPSNAGLEDMSNFMPMMQGMMKSLLSKDVLYPSLKDISEKYPTWLEENQDKTDPKELEKYKKQFEYMQNICAEYEAEQESDSEIVKQQRFDRVLDHMQHMQELGYPPKELVGDMPAFESAFSGLMQGSEQCAIM